MEDPDGGAAPAPGEPSSFTTGTALPGDLVVSEGVLRFQPCRSDDAQTVEDATGGEALEIVEELGYGDDRVRAVVVMDGARLVEVRYAAPEAVGCEGLLPDAHAEARGNEPFWSLRVTGNRALWRTPEEMDGIEYGDGSWEREGEGRWRFEARRDEVDGVEFVTLVLTEERCLDTMSGARFPFVARAEQGGRSWEGCALEGSRAMVAGSP